MKYTSSSFIIFLFSGVCQCRRPRLYPRRNWLTFTSLFRLKNSHHVTTFRHSLFLLLLLVSTTPLPSAAPPVSFAYSNDASSLLPHSSSLLPYSFLSYFIFFITCFFSFSSSSSYSFSSLVFHSVSSSCLRNPEALIFQSSAASYTHFRLL